MENVRQLSVYHVHFSEDEFDAIRNNPKVGLAALGAEALASIGLTPESDVTVMVAEPADPEARAAQDDATREPASTHWCCYFPDDLTMVCHRGGHHRRGVV
jgi:hypothetical protein